MLHSHTLLFDVLRKLGVNSEKIRVTSNPIEYLNNCNEYSNLSPELKRSQLELLKELVEMNEEEVCISASGDVYVLLSPSADLNTVRHVACHICAYLKFNAALWVDMPGLLSQNCGEEHEFLLRAAINTMVNVVSDILADLYCRKVFGNEYWNDAVRWMREALNIRVKSLEFLPFIMFANTLIEMVYMGKHVPRKLLEAINSYIENPNQETAFCLVKEIMRLAYEVFDIDIRVKKGKHYGIECIELDIEPFFVACA